MMSVKNGTYSSSSSSSSSSIGAATAAVAAAVAVIADVAVLPACLVNSQQHRQWQQKHLLELHVGSGTATAEQCFQAVVLKGFLGLPRVPSWHQVA
jgi:hypothetical protein